MPDGVFKKLFGTSFKIPQKTAGNPGSTPAPAPVETTPPMAQDSFSPSVKNQRFDDESLKAVLSGKTLKVGEKGAHVAKIQQALIDLGFAMPSGADGGFGGQTQSALKGFQTSQGLPETGELDAKTLRALDEVSPAPGKKAWEDPDISPKAYAQPQKVGDQFARVIVDKSEHRLFLYGKGGDLEHIYPVATGAKGTETDSGIKVVSGKIADPSSIGKKLWDNPKAFGTKIIDLSWYDPNTKRITRHGEELHGTYNDNSIGTNASHGCMRLYNKDVEELYGILKQGDRVVVKD